MIRETRRVGRLTEEQENNVKRDENEQRAAAELLRDVTFTGSPVRQLTRAPKSRLLKA